MRIGTRSIYGMGDCFAIAGTPYCRDNNTGAQVLCTDAACSKPSLYAAPVEPLPGGSAQTAQTGIPGFTGEFSVPTLEARLTEDIHLRTVYGVRDYSVPPDEIYGILAETARQYCAMYPGACPSQGQVAALVEKKTQEYRDWYNARLTEYYNVTGRGSSEPMPNMPAPPAGYVPPTVYVSGPGYEAQQNALNRTAPEATQITPVGTQNVLQNQAPNGAFPNATGANAATGTTTLTTRPGEEGSQQMNISGWLEDNWVLLAAAGAALVLLPNLMGGRR